MLGDALLAFGVCGIIGVLIDGDHILGYLMHRERGHWRVLHKPVLIISCLLLCGLVAYCGGLHLEEVLK